MIDDTHLLDALSLPGILWQTLHIHKNKSGYNAPLSPFTLAQQSFIEEMDIASEYVCILVAKNRSTETQKLAVIREDSAQRRSDNDPIVGLD